jgi:hypothetical protein
VIEQEPTTSGTVYGVHTFVHPDSYPPNPEYTGSDEQAKAEATYEVHHWGLCFNVDLGYAGKPGETRLMVVAMVSGSMCYFGLDEHPDAMSFGPYMAEVLDMNPVKPTFVGVATFNPATNKFALVPEHEYSFNPSDN